MIIVNMFHKMTARYQLEIPDSFKVKWDDRVIWISIKKTVRITVGVLLSLPFSFILRLPVRTTDIEWIMVVEFGGYYQAQFLWNFQECCSKSIHFFIDLSINKEKSVTVLAWLSLFSEHLSSAWLNRWSLSLNLISMLRINQHFQLLCYA